MEQHEILTKKNKKLKSNLKTVINKIMKYEEIVDENYKKDKVHTIVKIGYYFKYIKRK